jgi:hypothetical protein
VRSSCGRSNRLSRRRCSGAWARLTPRNLLSRHLCGALDTVHGLLSGERALSQVPSESSHRTRSIAAMTAGSSESSPSAPEGLGVLRHPHRCWTCGSVLRFPGTHSPIARATALTAPRQVTATGARGRANQRSSGRSSRAVAKPGLSARNGSNVAPASHRKNLLNEFVEDPPRRPLQTLP